MNNIIISHITALNILRKFRINNPQDNASKINYLNDDFYKMNSNGKIDVLVDSTNKRGSSAKYRHHLAPKGFTLKSTFKISDNLYCVCPELLVIQLSTTLNFINLYLLISELCGTYSINPITQEFIPEIKQATTINKIIKYRDNLMCNCKFMRGSKLLDQVLKITKENSASPMESRSMLKLSGPRKLGFYGIQNLEFNKPVTLSKAASLIAGQSKVIPDISNAQFKVAVEYDSAQFHENSEQGQKDKRRRDALVHDGWKVHSIVPSIMNNPDSFHEVAILILKETNQNVYIRNKNFVKNRNHSFLMLQ